MATAAGCFDESNSRTNGTKKFPHATVNTKMNTTPRPGRISGTTIRLSAVIALAPSIQAASSRATGTESMKFLVIQIAIGSAAARTVSAAVPKEITVEFHSGRKDSSQVITWEKLFRVGSEGIFTDTVVAGSKADSTIQTSGIRNTAPITASTMLAAALETRLRGEARAGTRRDPPAPWPAVVMAMSVISVHLRLERLDVHDREGCADQQGDRRDRRSVADLHELECLLVGQHRQRRALVAWTAAGHHPDQGEDAEGLQGDQQQVRGDRAPDHGHGDAREPLPARGTVHGRRLDDLRGDLGQRRAVDHHRNCLLYTSDAADEEDSVALGGR